MSYGDIIGGINEAAKLGSKFGTERARALLDALGSPDKGLKIIRCGNQRQGQLLGVYFKRAQSRG